jgi:hypothetical protein
MELNKSDYVGDSISQSPFDPIDFDGDEDDDTDSVTEFDQEESSFVNSESSGEEYKLIRESSDGQISLSAVLPNVKNYEEMSDDERAGDLVWDPSVCENSSITEFLKTANSDIDRNSTSNDDPACSVDLAMSVLLQCHFNVTEATSELKKKRSLTKWSESDIDDFEKGMRNHYKDFNKIKQNELVHSNKTTADILQYYYIWKKLPRYSVWQEQKTQEEELRSQKLSRPIVPSAVFPSQEETRSFSSNVIEDNSEDQMLHRSNLKRKHSEITPVVYDISVQGGLDYDKLRRIKRLRLGLEPFIGDPLQDDISLSDNENFWDETSFTSISHYGPMSVSSDRYEDDVDTCDTIPSLGIISPKKIFNSIPSDGMGCASSFKCHLILDDDLLHDDGFITDSFINGSDIMLNINSDMINTESVDDAVLSEF